MISTVQGFANRHRRALVITAGISGGIYMMGKYAKSKLFEFQEKSASERTAKENMKRRFEQNQQDCVFTVLSLLPTLGDQLLHELNVELITAKLQQTRSQRATPLPTPDSSMILPPKPASSEEGEEKESTDAADQTAKESTEDPSTKESAEETTTSTEASTEEGAETRESSGAAQKATETEATSESAQEDNKEVSGTKPEESTEAKDDQSAMHAAVAAAAKNEAEVAAAAAIDRRTKLELWNELKIMSFTRTVTALYSLTFLTLLTQVQLNLLGRFTYVSSVVAMSNTTDASCRVEGPSTKGSMSATSGQLDFQTEKKYLTFSYWLLHEGWRRWSDKVREVVEDVVGSISLKKTLTAKDFSEIIGEIRERLEYTEVNGVQVPTNMREYMLPDDASDEREVLRAGGVDEFDLIVDPVLRNLLDETRDFIDSEDFTTVLHSTLTTTFARFNLALQPTFNPFLLSESHNSRATIEEIEDEDDIDRAVPLASLLPLVARQVHLIINGVPNEYVESLAMVKELQAFSAIVYSSFSEQLIN